MLDRPEATLAMYRRAPKVHELQPILLPSMPDFTFRDSVRSGSPPDSDPNAKFDNQPSASERMSVEFSAEGLQPGSTTSSAPNLDDLVFGGISFSGFNLLGKPSFLFNPTDNSYCKVNLDSETSILPRSHSKKFVCPRNPSRLFKKPDSLVRPRSRKCFSFPKKEFPGSARPQAAFEDSTPYVPQIPNPSNNYKNPGLF